MSANPSLQKRLSFWLIMLTTIMAGIAGTIAFYHNYKTALEYQDDLLRQTAALIDPQAQRNFDILNEVEIYVRELGQFVDGGQLPLRMNDGFHNLRFRETNYRVYVYTYPSGEQLAFSQATEFRDALAYTGAWTSTLPLLILIPILALCCILIIRRLFKPLHQLSQQIELRSDHVDALSTQNIPKEVYGFVEAINRLLQRIGLSVEQQQQFIANAAHEMRSPLTALSLQVERLAQDDLPADSQQRLALLQQSILRHRHLSEQLLSLTRSQTTDIQVNFHQALSITHLFRLVVQMLYPLAEQKNIDLGIREPIDDFKLKIDETALFTVIKNLADNAIRYIEQGGQVDLYAYQTHKHIHLIVEDNGTGIPEQERQKVLEPFYRINKPNNAIGSGLGLAIVYNIVKKLHGEIHFTDSTTFDHGLKVDIMLPIYLKVQD